MDALNYKQLILPLADMLYRFARSILKNDDQAKDAVQELNLKLWEKRNYLDTVDNLQAFTMKSMRNLCLDEIRKRKNNNDLYEDLHSEIPGPHQQVEENDMSKIIKNMIESLPELQKTVMRLRDIEGFEIEEIATITGLTNNAVTVNLSRARQKIRERINNEYLKVEKNVWIG